MSSYVVVDYTKDPESALYSTKACQADGNVPGLYDKNCKVYNDRYKMHNEYPTEQDFPFPSTEGNEYVFIPKRIMESKLGKETFIHKYADKQSCFQVDPVDSHSNNIQCSLDMTLMRPTQNLVLGQHISYRVTVLLLVITVILLAFIFVVGVYQYNFEMKTTSNV